MALKNNKSLGQHWLKNREILQDIADLALYDGVTTAVEIGPGLGTLSSALLRNFERLVAIEFDERLARNLPKSFPGKNLEVINADVLSVDLKSLNLPDNYVVAGNIPYYITSMIIQKFLHSEPRPKRIVLLIQKEVAERLAAVPGEYSILGLSAQIYADVSLGPVVGREFFTPPPKVDSQVVVLDPYEQPLATEKTMALIKLGFIAPRKKLISNLAMGLHLPREQIVNWFNELKLDANARPADLSIQDWCELEKCLARL